MKKINSLMLLALVFLLSCRTDQFPEKEAYNNTNAFQLTSKQISLNESKHKSKLLTELEKAKTELKKLKTDALGKTVTYGNGVSIDTDNVVYIENGPNYHTYTFTITRENAPADAPLENLVLSPLTDGTYRELLFTYNLNSVEKDNIANGIPVDPKGRVSVTELTKGTYNTDGQLAKTSCNWVETTIWIPCSSDDHHDGSNYWECEFVTSPNTANGTPPRAVVIEEYKCLLESDPGIGDGPGGSGPGSGDDGGGEGGTGPDDEPCNGNGVLTQPQQPGLTNPNGCTGIPTMPPTLATSFSMIVRSLPDDVETLLKSNTAFYNGLNTYYTANQTPQGENFVRWAAQFSWENQNVTWVQFQPMLTFLHNFLQDNPNANSHFLQYPEDLNKIIFKRLNYSNISDATFANKFASAFTEILIAEKNNTVSQVNVQNPTWTLAKEYMIYLIKQNAPSAVKYGRVIYEHSSQYFSQHPNSLQKVNEFIDYLKAAVEFEIPIEQNPKYMKWTDILLCWLFEIGDFPVNDTTGFTLPTIGFSGTDYTIKGIPSPNIIPMRYLSAHKMKNGAPDVNSVLDVKDLAIKRIKQGDLSPVSREWGFDSDATVETITKLDGLQFCLGSYITNIFITSLGNNQYKLTYIIKNKTGWQSGTRGLNDYNGNPTDDSIIPDKPRGTGVHLGGTIGETFGWYEIITVN